MTNVAPTPPTDILETLNCRHAVATTFVYVFCTNATIILRGERFATHFILVVCFIRANSMLLLFIFFEDERVNVVPASAALSFAITFPRAFEAGFFLDVVAVLSAFPGGEIKAQFEHGDVQPPAPSSTNVASTFADGECAFFDTGPSTLKTNYGGLGALTTSLIRRPDCTCV